MKKETLVKRTLPQNPDIEVYVPNYKEPILPVNHGGYGWYGLRAFNEEGQLMCHECGKFFDRLGGHTHKHGLSSREYKDKYGLLFKVSLSSQRHIGNRKRCFETRCQKNPYYSKWLSEHGRRVLASAKPHGNYNRAEYQNMADTCDAQLIRRLLDASKVYGATISAPQANVFDSWLVELLIRRFGSFNKAKQIAKLVTNARRNIGEVTYTKQLVLEDMCCFHSKHGRWPVWGDYRAGGTTICSNKTVLRLGGLLALRQEAMKLKEEQDARAELAEQVPRFADKIELEFAGCARR